MKGECLLWQGINGCLQQDAVHTKDVVGTPLSSEHCSLGGLGHMCGCALKLQDYYTIPFLYLAREGYSHFVYKLCFTSSKLRRQKHCQSLSSFSWKAAMLNWRLQAVSDCPGTTSGFEVNSELSGPTKKFTHFRCSRKGWSWEGEGGGLGGG